MAQLEAAGDIISWLHVRMGLQAGGWLLPMTVKLTFMCDSDVVSLKP